MFERFSEQARRVLFFARAEVSDWGSPQVEPAHLLLGIIREGKGAAYELLFDSSHVDARTLVRDVQGQLEKRPRFATSIEIPFSSSTKEVLTATVAEAERLHDREIGTEHLLLGILCSDSAASAALASHGVTLELARQTLRHE